MSIVKSWLAKSSKLTSIAVLLLGVFFASLLFFLRPAPGKQDLEKVAALVSAQTLEEVSEKVLIVGYGTASAKRELEVRPQVSGQIVSLSKSLQAGGRVKQGELLIQIDPRDYEIALEAQKAALVRAKFELKLEKGNQIVAQKEWELLSKGMETEGVSSNLALRVPHLKDKEAALKAARNQLKRAELDLERTSIRAPFDAVVLEEMVERGTFVNPQTLAARIAGVKSFFVTVRVTRQDLEWIDLEALNKKPQKVRVVQTLSTGKEVVRQAKLLRLLSSVDEAGRMAQLLISVPEPLKQSDTLSPILLGTYLRVEIGGKEVSKVFEIPQSAMREGGKIWLVGEDNKLSIHSVSEVFSKGRNIYVRGELKTGDRVVTSSLSGALSGMLLEVYEQEAK